MVDIARLKFAVETGDLKKAQTELERLEKKGAKAEKSTNKLNNSFISLKASTVGVAASVYGIGKSISFLISSGIDYNKSMDASEAKLTAIISASRGYTTAIGEQVSAQKRQVLVNQEVSETMKILKQTNSKTAMGMSELIDIYALAKPGMDRYKWALSDQIEILKLTTNTASNFGMTAQELSTGIDDLAAGTWIASSGFGKMMKSLGVTKEEFKNTADKVEYLKDKMRETGEAQDTWAVAVSNFGVAWDTMTGEITKPVFERLKNSIKDVTKLLGQEGVKANKAFSYSFTEFAKIGVKMVGFVLKAVSQLIHTIGIAYKGYQQLGNVSAIQGNKIGVAWNKAAVAVGDFFGMDTSEDRKDLEGYNNSLSQRLDIQKKLTQETSSLIRSNNNINDSIDGVVSNFVEYKNTVTDTVKETDTLVSSTSEISKVTKNAGVTRKKALKDAQKEADKLKDKLEDADKFDSQFQLEAPTIVAEVFNPYVELIESQKEYIKNIKEAGNNQYRVDKINSKHMSQQLKGYAGLTNGLKGFFKEGSKGYKALDAAQKTLQAFEFAWFIKKQVLDNTVFAKRLANISTDTAATVASESTKSTVLGVNAVLSQGQGDPYSAFARMAAMAAVVAGLGVAISGGGGGGISEAQMKDAEGVVDFSDAVVNSIDELSEIEKEGLAYTQQMVNSLDELVRLTNSAAAKIGSSSLDLTGSNYTDTTDKGFWNDKSIELVSSGITLHETSIHDLINGYISANAYTIEKITNSGFLGIGSSEKLKETDLGQIDTALGKDLAGAYEAGIDAQKYAAEVLGISGEQFMTNAENWHTSLQRLNFEGKTEAEIAEMINGAISNDLDTLATTVMPHIEQFRIAGDTQMQTLIRLGAQHEAVSLQFELFGQKVGDFVASDTLIQAAGGLQKFQSAMQIFTTNFFSEEEQKAMQKRSLELALAVHNITLPASKAQFKALVLETQAKIIAVKSQIETMKASIRADIAVNKFKIEADGNYARSAVSTANNINKAAVHIGTSAHDMIEAAKGAGKVAGAIDYTDAYQKDVGLQALEGELSKLEGIYGSLMSNMGAFASHYNGVESASKSVTSAVSDAQKALTELAESIIKIQSDAQKSLLEFNSKGIDAVQGRLQEAVNNVDYKGAAEEFNNLIGRIKSDTQTTYKDKVFAIADANNQIQGIEKNDPNAKLIAEVRRLRTTQEQTNERLSAQERVLRDIENNTETSSRVVGGQ